MGDKSWDGTGVHTKVNSVLGTLCRYYYPGAIVISGEKVAAHEWSHWGLKPYMEQGECSNSSGSSGGRTCQSVVWSEFWDRFRLENVDDDDREAWREIKRHFCRAAEKVVKDAMYNARITAVNNYFKTVKKQNMSKDLGAARIYLSEEQYLESHMDWIVKDMDAWRWFAKKWASPEWIAESEKHRANKGDEPGHKYGADGHYGLSRCLEAKTGQEQSWMSVYVQGHRGTDPTNQDVLCTEAAKEKLVRYGKEMTRRHGSDFDWMNSDLDVEALYHSGDGRRHGRFAFGTGVVDFDASLRRGRVSSSSEGSSRSGRRKSCEAELQEEAREAREDARQAREEAQQGLQAIVTVHDFLSTATHFISWS